MKRAQRAAPDRGAGVFLGNRTDQADDYFHRKTRDISSFREPRPYIGAFLRGYVSREGFLQRHDGGMVPRDRSPTATTVTILIAHVYC